MREIISGLSLKVNKSAVHELGSCLVEEHLTVRLTCSLIVNGIEIHLAVDDSVVIVRAENLIVMIIGLCNRDIVESLCNAVNSSDDLNTCQYLVKQTGDVDEPSDDDYCEECNDRNNDRLVSL